jgi:signal transduction histidine kinase/CheY-like chemotaxis protein
MGALMPPDRLRALPLPARLFVVAVVAVGAAELALSFPRAIASPRMLLALIIAACVISVWKIRLPIAVGKGSTLSLADAANVMSLLLLGPEAAAVVAVAGVLTQCTYRRQLQNTWYSLVFSMAVAAITLIASGAVYTWMGGERVPTELATLFGKPLVVAIAAYFLVNTTLVASAIAVSTGRTLVDTWRSDFLWSASSFMVAGAAGAFGAVVVARGEYWKALVLLAPVYLTYRTYEAFVDRLDSEQRHTEEIRVLHGETVRALAQAREAERALAEEKERLAAARASAEAANRLKDQFLAVVSHELRTPLNAILGWSDLMCRGSLDPEQRERASRTIRDSARRQAQLVDDLLDVARIAAGKLRLERSRLDLREVVADALQVVQPAADAKRITVRIESSDDVAMIDADAARIQQIAWNLVSNAVKFTPEGGSVVIRLAQIGSMVEMAVIDSGNGIAPEFLPHVFDAFRQGDASPTRLHNGLGLGLSIVKSLVDAHRGTVTARSDGEHLGATFTVRLPAIVATQAAGSPMPRPILTLAEAEAPLTSVSVLVVDDDPGSLEVVAAHLAQSGATVVTASSADEAIERMQAQHVDVLLSDIGMPGEDGYSLMRRVRALGSLENACIPAVALTALGTEDARRHALDAGFQIHLVKPVDPHSLVATVAALKGVAGA